MTFGWQQPYRSEEFWFMRLDYEGRYGLVAWLADGTSKGYNPSVHYEDGGIQPRLPYPALSDAQDWVERMIVLSSEEARQVHWSEQQNG